MVLWEYNIKGKYVISASSILDYICCMNRIKSWRTGIPVIILVCNLLLGFSSNSHAQVNPPDFLCVENDTLRWVPEANPCGPFLSFDIYFSDDINGPYTLLSSITDPNAVQYHHNNANSAVNIWYYYIEAVHDCPGEAIIASDTLDNRDPDFPPIDAVTVTGNDVEIFWTPSQAPETSGYIIYKKLANGNFEPIDTVYPGTADYFLDSNADPTVQVEEYTIIAIDECGNTSIFNTLPHSTILLNYTIDPCTQSALLDWNLYQNWAEGVDSHEVWVSIDGATAELAATLSASATNYVYENLNDGLNYCFTVRANRTNSTFSSASNEVCETVSIIQPNRNLNLFSASFTENDDIELIWRWDINAEINNVDINISSDNLSFGNVDAFAPSFPLTLYDTTYVSNHDADLGKRYFQVVTTDDCDSTSISTYAATIHIDGQANSNFLNYLEWTDFDIENGELIEYRLYKKTDVGTTILDVIPAGETSYLDDISNGNIYDANACYYVTALARVSFPDGTIAFVNSRSNTVCLNQFTTIQFPNAFAPDGENNEFKPLVVYPSIIASYEMNIFDRWGQMVFTTNQPERGWDGKIKGNKAKQGIYIYKMRMVQTDGKVDEQKGSLMLVR